MLDGFTMNGIYWAVRFVSPTSDALIDRTGKLRLATTDSSNYTVYLSRKLKSSMLTKVFLHELGHCTMISYGLLDEIHSKVNPQYWVYMEEWICNFIADYGLGIFKTAYRILGDKAWERIPSEIEKLIA